MVSLKFTNQFEKKSLYKYLNWMIIAYAFLLPISKAAISFFSVLIILTWIFIVNYKEAINILKGNSFFIILGAFFCFSTISLLYSSDFSFALSYLKKYWHFLILPIIYTSLSKEYVERVFNGFLYGIIFSVLFSLGIFLELFKYKNIEAFDPSPFMDHTNYGIYLSFAIFISFYKIIKEVDLWKKNLNIIFLVLIVIDLFLISGRTGQISFVLSLVFISMFYIKNKIKILFILIPLLFITITLAYNFSNTFKTRMDVTKKDIFEMYTENKFEGGLGQRVSFWIVGINVISDNFIIGTGIGDEFDDGDKYIKKYNLEKKYMPISNNYMDYHNAFLQYFIQLGILGFFLFCSFFYILWNLEIKNKMYTLLNKAFIVNFFLLSMIGLSLHIMASMVLFTLFSGVFLAISRIENS